MGGATKARAAVQRHRAAAQGRPAGCAPILTLSNHHALLDTASLCRRSSSSMKNPPHPGKIVRQECIEALGLTVTAAAKGLGVTRKTLSELVNGNSGMSPEMAIRLSKAFGSSPEVWLGLQMDYDLAQMQRTANRIRELSPAA